MCDALDSNLGRIKCQYSYVKASLHPGSFFLLARLVNFTHSHSRPSNFSKLQNTTHTFENNRHGSWFAAVRVFFFRSRLPTNLQTKAITAERAWRLKWRQCQTNECTGFQSFIELAALTRAVVACPSVSGASAAAVARGRAPRSRCESNA